MSLTVSKTRSEWLVAKDYKVSVCASVENGTVKRVDINGLKDDTIYTDLEHLRYLSNAMRELLQEIAAAQERTKPPEERDE